MTGKYKLRMQVDGPRGSIDREKHFDNMNDLEADITEALLWIRDVLAQQEGSK